MTWVLLKTIRAHAGNRRHGDDFMKATGGVVEDIVLSLARAALVVHGGSIRLPVMGFPGKSSANSEKWAA